MRLLTLLVLAAAPAFGHLHPRHTPGRNPAPPSEISLPPSCRHAQAALHGFLSGVAVGCHSDADCEIYYLAGSCERPVALPRDRYNSVDKTQLGRLQAQTRKDCPTPAVACAPIAANARCIQQRCIVR
jgi:hypothetical protein